MAIIHIFRFFERLVLLERIPGRFAPVKGRDRSVYLTPLHNAGERNWRAAKPSQLDARVSIIGTRWKLRRLSVAQSSIENRFDSGGVIASSRTSLLSLSLSPLRFLRLLFPPSPPFPALFSFSLVQLFHPLGGVTINAPLKEIGNPFVGDFRRRAYLHAVEVPTSIDTHTYTHRPQDFAFHLQENALPQGRFSLSRGCTLTRLSASCAPRVSRRAQARGVRDRIYMEPGEGPIRSAGVFPRIEANRGVAVCNDGGSTSREIVASRIEHATGSLRGEKFENAPANRVACGFAGLEKSVLFGGSLRSVTRIAGETEDYVCWGLRRNWNN